MGKKRFKINWFWRDVKAAFLLALVVGILIGVTLCGSYHG